MYYPKSQIQSNKYTTGNELMVVRTKENYVGFYYTVSNGKAFAGKEPNGFKSEELMHVVNNAPSISNDNENWLIKNILSGKTKRGVFGEEFIQINKQIVDLSQPLLTDEAKSDIFELINEPIDPTGRGWQNLIKMMHSDGLFQFLPKRDDGWTEFFTPLLKLARNEKQIFSKNNKRKIHERKRK